MNRFAALMFTMTLPIASLAQQASNEELAKKLSNPVAALISVPLQLNYDQHYGSADGDKWTLNLQPVIPLTLNAEWNVISRTILPIVSQDNVVPGTSKWGIGDVLQSFFFSPKAPTAGGVIWGVGPALLLPTGSGEQLSAEKWGLGPTGVVLKQEGHWTYGALANHIWSVGGSDNRPDINATYLQPFLTYTTAHAWTFGINTESTYDWEASQWSVPLNGFITKLLKVGGQPLSIGGGFRYWADSPDNGPHDLGFRIIFTLLFPK